MRDRINIASLYLLLSVALVVADAVFSYYLKRDTAGFFSASIILLVIVGLLLLFVQKKKKLIIMGLVINLIWIIFFASHFVLFVAAQESIFTEDSRNLAVRDPFLFKAYSQIRMGEVWDFLNSRDVDLTDIKVGIIDTGVDASDGRHPEFQEVFLNALSPQLFEDSEGDRKGHGTQVAGIIGANNISFPDPANYAFPHMNGILSGIHGLNYSLELGKSPTFLSIFSAASTIDALVKREAKIINMSFGTRPLLSPVGVPIFTPMFFRAFARNPDVLFVASAGNFEFDFLGFDVEGVDAELVVPANLGDNFNNVVTVGATDTTLSREDSRASFSSFGSVVSVAAPGVAVYSPAPRGRGNFPIGALNYDQFFSGTSAAAPMVTGVAAVLKTLEPEYQKFIPGLMMDPTTIKNTLVASADPIQPDKRLGFGCFNETTTTTGCRLNAHRAVAWFFPPASTTLSVAATTSDSISISWVNPLDFAFTTPDFDSYRIFRSTTSPVTLESTLVETTDDVNQLSFTETNLQSKTEFFYKVFVFDKAGLYAASNEVSAKTGVTAPPEGFWSVFRHDARSTGRSTFSGPTASPSLLWNAGVGGRSEPAIGFDGTIYIISDSHALFAVDDSGRIKWSFQGKAPTVSPPGPGNWATPAVDRSGVVYFPAGNFYALNPDGTAKWVFENGDESFQRCSPTIAPDGTIYAMSHRANLYAFNPDGSIRWTADLGSGAGLGGTPCSPAIGDDGTLYVAVRGLTPGRTSELVAVNPDGTLKWTFGLFQFEETSPVVGDDGTIYISSGEGFLYGIRPNGTVRWSRLMRSSSFFSSVSLNYANGRIYFANSGFPFKLYSLDGSSGAVVWERVVNRGVFCIGSVDQHNNVFVNNDSDTVFSFDQDGNLNWELFVDRVGGQFEGRGCTVVGSDGVLYYSSPLKKLGF